MRIIPTSVKADTTGELKGRRLFMANVTPTLAAVMMFAKASIALWLLTFDARKSEVRLAFRFAVVGMRSELRRGTI